MGGADVSASIRQVTIGGSLSVVASGPFGDADLRISNAQIDGDARLITGGGDDLIEIQQMLVGDHFELQTHEGNDTVLIGPSDDSGQTAGFGLRAESAKFLTDPGWDDTGNDFLSLENSTFSQTLVVYLYEGDDQLYASGNEVGGAAYFKGGDGTDTVNPDIEDVNQFGELYIEGFEVWATVEKPDVPAPPEDPPAPEPPADPPTPEPPADPPTPEPPADPPTPEPPADPPALEPPVDDPGGFVIVPGPYGPIKMPTNFPVHPPFLIGPDRIIQPPLDLDLLPVVTDPVELVPVEEPDAAVALGISDEQLHALACEVARTSVPGDVMGTDGADEDGDRLALHAMIFEGMGRGRDQ